jgi:hypothetical protein
LISALLDRAWRDFGLTTPVYIAHVGTQNQLNKVFPKTRSDAYTKGYLCTFEEFNGAQLLTPGLIHQPESDAYKGKVALLVPPTLTLIALKPWLIYPWTSSTSSGIPLPSR